MYAERYTGDRRFSLGGLAAAVGINAAVIGALMVAAPLVTKAPAPDGPLETYRVPIEPPPPPDPAPRREAKAPTRIEAPLPPLPLPPTDRWTVQPLPPIPDEPTGDGTMAGTGTGPVGTPTPVPALPVIVAPGVDPRYAGDFQPAYPPSEQRLGNVGTVTVRVLIGIDGRVKQVERVAATSDAFFRATERQALSRWRFRPGTRDGVAQEAWRTMTVRFVLDS
ncbi:energy transducer TonB [Sphingomonas sp. KR1UV-12]|uniref:Energy transducer TonB n=1 Tax=Sphingomonas aurea TaxID=3063994 RepID=A0ABT9EM70_9SPHN|nr:energy transducer TonB [Sphingomonas sp. KR1UV-12]MDP1028052.1 energy transducer TonB [Sphingomonas sp. KR1UV-12]